jgi:hypothetical protein
MKTILFLIIVSVLPLLGCGSTVEPKPELPTTFTKEAFPVSVGNWWRYKIYDSLTFKTDTLILRVVSGVDTNGVQSYTCNVEMHNKVVDTSTFEISKTQLSYKGNYEYYSYFGNFILKFPFKAGESWIGRHEEDTVRAVNRFDSISFLGKLYQPAFSLERAYGLVGNYSFRQSIVVCPSIGIIRQSIREYISIPTQRSELQLIDYYRK